MSHHDTAASHGERARIEMSQDYELRVWARSFGVTLCELRDAVQTVGNAADDVRRHLSRSAG